MSWSLFARYGNDFRLTRTFLSHNESMASAQRCCLYKLLKGKDDPPTLLLCETLGTPSRPKSGVAPAFRHVVERAFEIGWASVGSPGVGKYEGRAWYFGLSVSGKQRVVTLSHLNPCPVGCVRYFPMEFRAPAPTSEMWRAFHTLRRNRKDMPVVLQILTDAFNLGEMSRVRLEEDRIVPPQMTKESERPVILPLSAAV